MDGSEEKRIAILDALRGVASLIVVIWHFRWCFAVPFFAVLKPFYIGGWVAVDLFFVLSGFILTKVYYTEQPSAAWLKTFALHRFARIYPLHFFTLAVICALLAISGSAVLYPGYPLNDFSHLIQNLFLLQWDGLSFNGPSWSISTEMFANVFLAAAIFLAGGVRLKIVCAVGLLISIVLLIFFLQSFPNGFILQTAVGFLSGCLLALWRKPLRVESGYVAGAGVIFLLCIVFSVVWMLYASTLHGAANLSERISHVCLDVFVFPAMIVSGMKSKVVTSIAGWRIFSWLGAVSYSTYLWHFPIACIFVMIGINRLGISAENFLLLYLGIVFLVSDLSFRFFERPVRRGILALRRKPVVFESKAS